MARRNQKRHHARTPRVAHEPSIDSVVTKIPRFAFEKFPQAGACARPPSLTTQMKSVGEAMAIASPTLFICVVSDGGRAQAPACGNFSKAKRGILVTTESMLGALATRGGRAG